MYSINRRGLTVNDCVHMAIHTQNVHLRQYWMSQAERMMEVNKPITHSPQYAEGGLTMQMGGLYHQQAGQAHRDRVERINRTGTTY